VAAGSGATGWLTAQQLHVVDHLEGSQEPLLPEALNRRIREAAEEYKAAGEIPRIALYDLAFPASQKELTELNQNAVVLITALTQDPSELPLGRVFVADGESEVELVKLSALMSQVRSDLVARVFGKNRQDSMFLLPVRFTLRKATLKLDFARSRSGFTVGQLKPPPHENGMSWSEKPAGDRVPSQAALEHLIEREYPGLLAK
jgi:hypothetical protein